MGRPSGGDSDKPVGRVGPPSLAGRLGSIPRPAQNEKPRPPSIEKPQTAPRVKPGAAKPRSAKPNKPPRPVVAQRPSSTHPAAPATTPPPRGVAGRLGSIGRGRGGR
jgi:hypothetical protein